MSAGFRPPRPTGSDPEARFMQWVWDRLTRLKFISTPSVVFEELTNGIRATATSFGGGGSSTSIKKFVIKDVNDYKVWSCREWNDDTQSETGDYLYVAKPANIWAVDTASKTDPHTGSAIVFTYEYPESEEDTKSPTNSRLNTLYRIAYWSEGGDKQEEQDVVPYVELGHIIYAVKTPTGINMGTEQNPDRVIWLALSQGWAWTRRFDSA